MSFPQKPLSVALLQLTTTDDVAANFAHVLSLLGQIRDPANVDLVILPENCLYLRINRDEKLPSFDLSEPEFRDLQKFVETHQLEIWLGSIALNEGESVSNAMIRLSPGRKPEVIYRKVHLFDVEVEGHMPVRESAEFRHGPEPRMLTINGWKIGLSICYDVRFAELYTHYAREGAHAIIVPSAFLVPTGKIHWDILLRARAIESQAFVLAPAQGGEHKGRKGGVRQTWGHSLIIDPWGQVIDEGSDSNRILQCTLEPQVLKSVRNQIPMHLHRRL